MLTVLGGLAEFERELIKARTAEGRARARAQGVRFGRKPKLTPHQRQDPASRGRRGAGRHRPDLQRESLDDQPTLRAPCAQPTVRTPKPSGHGVQKGVYSLSIRELAELMSASLRKPPNCSAAAK